jgi:hypothetical protein
VLGWTRCDDALDSDVLVQRLLQLAFDGDAGCRCAAIDRTARLISRCIGHSRTSTTQDIYRHVSPSGHRAAMDKLRAAARRAKRNPNALSAARRGRLVICATAA